MSHTLTISFTPVSPAPPNGYRVKYWKLSNPALVTTIFPNPTTSPINITVPNFESYAGTVEASCTGGTYSTIQNWTANEQFVMQAYAITKAPDPALGAGIWIINSYTEPFTIIWGDGNTDTYGPGNINVPSHTYSSPYTGPIIIECADLSSIWKMDITNGAFPASTSPRPITIQTTELSKLDGLLEFIAIDARVRIEGIISDLPSSLTNYTSTITNLSGNLNTMNLPNIVRFLVTGSNTLTGDIGNFSNTCDDLTIFGNNTISGVVADWPTSLKNIFITGANQLSGLIQNAPPNMEEIYILGNNFIGGTIQSMACPNIELIQVQGATTIGGSINTFTTNTNFANLKRLILIGSNTVGGNIANFNTGIEYIQMEGNNTLSGNIEDLPGTVEWFRAWGNNTIAGNIDNGLPTGITNLYVIGGGVITGDTDNLAGFYPAMTQFSVIGPTTLTGDMANLPSTLTTFSIGGTSHTMTGDIAACPAILNYLYLSVGNLNTTTYTAFPKVWASIMVEIYLRRSPSYTSTELDNLFIDWDNSTTSWGGSKFINVQGTVTAASLAARNSLITKGVTINIIP